MAMRQDPEEIYPARDFPAEYAKKNARPLEKRATAHDNAK